MKIPTLKFKKDSVPKISSFRPTLFKTEEYWMFTLIAFLLILMVTGFLGFKMFYSLYTESYKNQASQEETTNTINVNRLKNAIKDRNNRINTQDDLPRDPSRGSKANTTSTTTVKSATST